jgi:hypothetical protein
MHAQAHHARYGAAKLEEAGSAPATSSPAPSRRCSTKRPPPRERPDGAGHGGRHGAFVGLFGTVWGVYHALVAIGMSGAGTLDKVAGPVGEALIMTGLGLAVAIPAVMGYNCSRGQPRAGVAARRLRLRAAHLPVDGPAAERGAGPGRQPSVRTLPRPAGRPEESDMAFASFDSKSASAPMAEINMVPLIDVMLVLLVIFIVTAPLLTHAVKLDLPRASAQVNQLKPDKIDFAIDAAGALLLERRAGQRAPRPPSVSPPPASASRSPRCTCAPTSRWPTASWRRRWPTRRVPG